MKKSIPLKMLLVVSGLIGLGIGSALLFTPARFEASAGIKLGDNINLLNEIRAPGGVLLFGGIIILLGAFISQLMPTAILLSSLLYTAYGIARLISIAFDGMPSSPLMLAMIVELTIGVLSLLILMQRFYNTKKRAL